MDAFPFPVTLGLIAINVAASLVAFANETFNRQNILWVGPMRENGEWHRAISSGFLHVNGPHLLINMYGLFMFGPIVERALGGTGFAVVYLASLAGGSAWAYLHNRNNPDYRAAGASGALSGIVLAFCMIAPFTLLLFLFLIPMWGIVFGLLFIGLSYILSQRENRIIGHEAHLGGAVTGMIATVLVDPDVLVRFLAQLSARLG
jgi:membrane associated rhomboid family serine protease